MGSGTEVLESAVNLLNGQGQKVGLVKVRGAAVREGQERGEGGVRGFATRGRRRAGTEPARRPPLGLACAAPCAGAAVPPLVGRAPAGRAAAHRQAHHRAGPHQGARQRRCGAGRGRGGPRGGSFHEPLCAALGTCAAADLGSPPPRPHPHIPPTPRGPPKASRCCWTCRPPSSATSATSSCWSAAATASAPRRARRRGAPRGEGRACRPLSAPPGPKPSAAPSSPPTRPPCALLDRP
jgi:hypothetical protein